MGIWGGKILDRYQHVYTKTFEPDIKQVVHMDIKMQQTRTLMVVKCNYSLKRALYQRTKNRGYVFTTI